MIAPAVHRLCSIRRKLIDVKVGLMKLSPARRLGGFMITSLAWRHAIAVFTNGVCKESLGSGPSNDCTLF